MNRIVLGTRGSALALAQAEMTEGALRASGFTGEIVREIISTSGDQRLDIKLSDFAKEQVVTQGAFTKELEDALLAGVIDAAVHSLKDLPSRLDERFGLAAVMERAPVEDLLVTRGAACRFEDLPEGATLATSSVRRGRTAAWRRPDLKLIGRKTPLHVTKRHAVTAFHGLHCQPGQRCNKGEADAHWQHGPAANEPAA